MSVSLSVDHKKISTLYINGRTWSVDTMDQRFVLLDGVIIAHLPTTKDIHGEQLTGVKLFEFIYLLSKCEVIPFKASSSEIETLRSGLLSLNYGYRELQGSYEDEDERLHQVYYRIPFQFGSYTMYDKNKHKDIEMFGTINGCFKLVKQQPNSKTEQVFYLNGRDVHSCFRMDDLAVEQFMND